MIYFQWLAVIMIFTLFSAILSHFMSLVVLSNVYNEQLESAFIVLSNHYVDEKKSNELLDLKEQKKWLFEKQKNHFTLQWKTEGQVWLCSSQKKIRLSCIAEE